MADKDAAASSTSTSASGAAKAPKPPNPVFKMMGLPNFRFRLPSRNWMIFWTVIGTWSGAVIYDRREKKRIQRKWAKLVSHIAEEPLATNQMPRKVSIYLAAPPADTIVPAREHFSEYVKPILVAAALDWDAVEGRMQGDVRAGLAEKIRRYRRLGGEKHAEPMEEDPQTVLDAARSRSGVKNYEGVAGDIVIGRHTWKEYIRGLHEGWLGPLDAPPEPIVPPPAAEVPPEATTTPTDDASPTSPDTTPAHPEPEKEKPAEEPEKPKKKKQPPPFISTADYPSSILSSNCPTELPSAVIPMPHLLGFLNFPIRMYRFLNRRQVADEVGRETAAAVLAVYRPYEGPGESSSFSGDDTDDNSKWEQQRLFKHEEQSWHKTVRQPKNDDGKERVWLNDIVLDPRIGERMRRFALTMDAEEQVKNMILEPLPPFWRKFWPEKKDER